MDGGGCSDGRRLQLHLRPRQHVLLRFDLRTFHNIALEMCKVGGKVVEWGGGGLEPALGWRLREVQGCEETEFSAKNLAPISSSERGGNGARRRVRPGATARRSKPSFSCSVQMKTSPDSHRGELQVSPVALPATFRTSR